MCGRQFIFGPSYGNMTAVWGTAIRDLAARLPLRRHYHMTDFMGCTRNSVWPHPRGTPPAQN